MMGEISISQSVASLNTFVHDTTNSRILSGTSFKASKIYAELTQMLEKKHLDDQ